MRNVQRVFVQRVLDAALGLCAGAFVSASMTGCLNPGDDSGGTGNESEVLSRVELAFSPEGGGDAVNAAFDDPDGDGGMSGVSDDIVLQLGTDYTLDVRVFNGLREPPVELTDELRREAEEHLVLVLGEGVVGPASTSPSALVAHSYADLESDYGENAVGDDLPLGLSNMVAANSAGESELRVMLRHLPELNGNAQKQASLPAELADGASLPGDVDLDVTFSLRVQ